MPPRATRFQSNTVKRAIAAAPGTIKPKTTPAKRDARRFQAYTVSQLLETYRDPRAVLLEIAGMDTLELATILAGGNKSIAPMHIADAIAERRLCAQAVLPYVAQKLPVQVDMRHTRAIHLNIVDDRQYQDLVTVAATTEDADSFTMALIPSAPSDDETAGERDVTPTVPPPATEER